MTLAPYQIEAVRVVARIAEACGLRLVLIGATARMLGFERVHGIEPLRTTRDVDFAVQVTSWEELERLIAELCSPRNAQFERLLPHRIRHHAGCEIDLVPFGKVASEGRTLRWPSGMVMNVEGQAEAAAESVEVELAEDLVVRCVSPVGLVVTKAVAHLDRGLHNSKDLGDILCVAQRYVAEVDLAQLPEDFYLALHKGELDFESIGPRMLARHIVERYPAPLARRVVEAIRSVRGPDDPSMIALVPRSYDGPRYAQARTRAWETLATVANGIESDLVARP